MTERYRCTLCGKVTVGRRARWLHTYLEWPWWRPFNKSGPRHCVRWLP